jgi:hypothetical protein
MGQEKKEFLWSQHELKCYMPETAGVDSYLMSCVPAVHGGSNHSTQVDINLSTSRFD